MFGYRWLSIAFLIGSCVLAMGAPPTFELTKIAAPPIIDGDLSDTCWKEIAPLAGFTLLDAGDQAPRQTRARAATDGTWLFLAFDCDGAPPRAPIPRTWEQDAGSHQTDSVEIFFAPGSDGNRYFHFKISENGDQAETAHETRQGARFSDTGFNPHWRAAGKRTANGYAVEVAVPLFYAWGERKKNDAKDKAGWKVNFCRNDFSDSGRPVLSAWAPCANSFHAAEYWGTMTGAPTSGPRPFAPVLREVVKGVFSDATGSHVGPVNFTLRDDGDAAGTVLVDVEDRDVAGNGYRETKTVRLNGKEEKNDEIEIVYKSQAKPDPTLTVSFQDALGVWRRRAKTAIGGTVKGDLTLLVERSYYTTETRATVWVRYAEPIDGRALSLRISPEGGGAPVFEKKDIALFERWFPVEIGVADWKPGAYAVAGTILDAAGKSVANAGAVLRKCPPNVGGSEVKVDFFNRRVLVDETPFFPFGALMDGECFAVFRDCGFNVWFRWGGYRSYLTEVPVAEAIEHNEQREFCEKNRVMLVENPLRLKSKIRFKHRQTFAGELREFLRSVLPTALPIFKQEKALLAYMGIDEPGQTRYPDNSNLTDLSNAYFSRVREGDPYHPIFNNFSHTLPASAEWTGNSDVLCLYIYWVAHMTRGRELNAYAESAARVARENDKPFWVMGMDESAYSDMVLPLSDAEQVAQTYLFLVNGARGIVYFRDVPARKEGVETFRRLSREIQIMAPALLSREPEQKVVRVGGDDAIAVSLRRTPEGDPLLILVNKYDRVVDCSCSLPWLAAGAKWQAAVERDGVTTFSEKTVTTRFAPLDTRAFFIRGSRIEDIFQTREIRVQESYLSATPRKGADEVVFRSDFETDTGWTSKGDGTFSIVTVSPYEGQLCGQIRQEKVGRTKVLSPVFELSAGRKYAFSGAVRYALSKWKENVKNRQVDYSGVYARLLPEGKSGEAPDLPYFSTYEKTDRWQTFVRHFQTGNDAIPARVSLEMADNIGDAWFDAIRIVDLGPVKTDASAPGKNLLANSSFEYARLKGWPDRWTLLTPYDGARFGFVGSGAAAWEQSDEKPFHGKRCLRFSSNGVMAMTNAPYYRRWRSVQIKPGRSYALSFYARADRRDVKLTVEAPYIGKKTFSLGEDWARYSLVGGAAEPPVVGYGTGVRVSAPSQGTVWLDAIQLEEGPEPTSYEEGAYRPFYPFEN